MFTKLLLCIRYIKYTWVCCVVVNQQMKIAMGQAHYICYNL